MKKRSKIALREQRAAYLFLIPAFLGLSLITYLPVIAAFGIGFTDLKLGHFVVNGPLYGQTKFIGFQNFIDIFTNPNIDFLNSIKVTVYFAVLTVAGSIIYSMFVAVLLNRKIPARGFFRAIFYIPYILPSTAVIIGWGFLQEKQPEGLINFIIGRLGLTKVAFLSDARFVVPALALIAVWTSGNLIVIFLAGLQNVPRVYHEAAEIDGANAWQRFWSITIPGMTPIIFYNLLMSLVTSLQVVVPALARTKGGPGTSSRFMAYQMYRTGFIDGDFGRAGAIAFSFFIVAAILAFILFSTSNKWIFYEGGDDKS